MLGFRDGLDKCLSLIRFGGFQPNHRILDCCLQNNILQFKAQHSDAGSAKRVSWIWEGCETKIICLSFLHPG